MDLPDLEKSAEQGLKQAKGKLSFSDDMIRRLDNLVDAHLKSAPSFQGVGSAIDTALMEKLSRQNEIWHYDYLRFKRLEEKNKSSRAPENNDIGKHEDDVKDWGYESGSGGSGYNFYR